MLLFKGRVFPALIVGLDREKNSEHEQHHFQRNFQFSIVGGPAIIARIVVSLLFAESVELCQVSVMVGKPTPFYECLLSHLTVPPFLKTVELFDDYLGHVKHTGDDIIYSHGIWMIDYDGDIPHTVGEGIDADRIAKDILRIVQGYSHLLGLKSKPQIRCKVSWPV